MESVGLRKLSVLDTYDETRVTMAVSIWMFSLTLIVGFLFTLWNTYDVVRVVSYILYGDGYDIDCIFAILFILQKAVCN